MAETVVAPSLSTYQDESAFEFQQYSHKSQNRAYLGLDEYSYDTLVSKIREYYSVDELIKLLSKEENHKRKYKRITLQFPDALVADSAIIVQLLQDGIAKDSEKSHLIIEKDDHECQKTCSNCQCSEPSPTDNSQHVWILADTAYSACCVDEVAAEHVKSDIVIHYGDACLNAIQKLPVIYVFGKPALNMDNVIERFRETYPDKDSKVILMADAPHTRLLPDLYNLLRKEYKDIGFADIDFHKSNGAQLIGFQNSKIKNTHVKLSNRVLRSDSEIDEEQLTEYNLFHLTLPEPPHLLYLSTKFGAITVYDPSTDTTDKGPFPSLMRRYRYMHVARTAGTIGILVNTLSLRNTTEMITKVSQMIREADKKSYMFVVGKPNVAKLANFESIDVWCILGCGQGGIIIDQTSEFYKPIITPYELELSLNPMVQWSGEWVVDFENLLKEDCQGEEDDDIHTDETQSTVAESEEDAPIFNPVTGQLVSNSRPLRNIQHLEIESDNHLNEEGQLVKAFSQTVAIKGTVSTSAIHLQNREWTGLGSDYKNDEEYDEEGAIVEEGTGGIARGYDFDISNRK